MVRSCVHRGGHTRRIDKRRAAVTRDHPGLRRPDDDERCHVGRRLGGLVQRGNCNGLVVASDGASEDDGRLRREVALKDGTYAIRPIRPADALLYPQFLEKLEAEDIRLRFLAPRRHFPEQMLVRLTQLDYDRDMAFVALAPDGTLAGVSRISCDPDHTTGEYALLVRSDLHGRGIGTTLMRILIDYARADGVRALEGMILSENAGMLDLMRRFGFDFTLEPEDPGVMMSRLSL